MMKIATENIDYNALRMIEAVIDIPEEYRNDTAELLLVVAQIKGILDMVRVMKEVLKE